MSASIFISHASEDRKIAHTLCDALESRGFKCWIASRDIGAGENFQIAIVRAIRNARVMLLVFTANSNSSEEMSKELALASQHKLIVLPLRVEDVAPNDAFAYEFSTRQWIDFFADWEWAINQLCIRLANAMKAEDEEAAAAAMAASPTKPPSSSADAAASVEAAPAAKAAPTARPAPVETLKMPAAAAAAAAAAATAAKPAAAKPVPPKPVGPEKPAVTDGAEPEVKKSRVGLLAAAAAALIVVIGIGLAVPALMGKKPGAQASVPPEIKPAAATSAAPAPAVVQAAQPSAVVPASSSAPADSSAAAQLAANGDVSDSSAAPAPKVHTHHTHAAVHVATSRADLPY